MRLPRFIRRFFRKRTLPKDPQAAFSTKQKLSLVYAVVTWQLLGFIVYKLYRGQWGKSKEEEQFTDGRYYAQLLAKDNATLTRVSGLTKVGSWDLTKEKQLYGRLLTKEELSSLKGRSAEQRGGGGEELLEQEWREGETHLE